MERETAAELAHAWDRRNRGKTNDEQFNAIGQALRLVPQPEISAGLAAAGDELSALGVLAVDDNALYVVGRTPPDEEGGGASVERFPLSEGVVIRVTQSQRDPRASGPGRQRRWEFKLEEMTIAVEGWMTSDGDAPDEGQAFAMALATRIGWRELG